jgi:ribosome maturation factor RimP
MKERIKELINDSIGELFLDDAFVDTAEGKKRLNIVLDSEKVIDLNRITEASRVINKLLDKEKTIIEDIDEVDIYSKEKGDNN